MLPWTIHPTHGVGQENDLRIIGHREGREILKGGDVDVIGHVVGGFYRVVDEGRTVVVAGQFFGWRGRWQVFRPPL